jgi:ubiquinone/menaquinone biosynthesis C-methylase UbiE
VFEHVEDPAKACREFYRVLRPGGRVLINTNSIFNPFMFPNKFLSLSMRDRLKNVLHIESEGTFRAPYRANTKSRLRRYLQRAGFRHLRFYRWGLPGMMQPKWVLSLELCMELLSEIPIFAGLKHRLMVTAEK